MSEIEQKEVNEGQDRIKRRAMRIKDWSVMVKERDGYLCTMCSSAVGIRATRIEHRLDAPEKEFDLDNGKTLCGKCYTKEKEDHRKFRLRAERPNRSTLIQYIHELEDQLGKKRSFIRE